jgi:hypothetical protein
MTREQLIDSVQRYFDDGRFATDLRRLPDQCRHGLVQRRCR